MSRHAPSIDFVLAGGPTLGFGHVMRSGTIAAEAIRRGWCVRLYLEGDASAAAKLAEASGTEEIRAWTDWPGSEPGNLLLIDIPGDKSEWLDRSEQAGAIAIVLDDDRYRGRATLTICPALHAPPTESPRLVAGPRYGVLSSSHRGTTRTPLEARGELLLSLGGADPHRATLRVAPVLARLLDSSDVDHDIHSRHVVLGPGFQHADEAVGVLAEQGWEVHRALAQQAMARRMAQARLAVMGFGTSLSELAWLGTPHVSITHHACDDGAARELEARGIGKHLGFAPVLDVEALERTIRQALQDRDWQRSSAERALAALDGGTGATRILDRLEEIPIPGPPTRGLGPILKGSHVALR